MTVSATNNTDTFTGTGANTALSTTFPFFNDADLVVTRRVTATGVETTMVLTTDYTVTGGSNAIGTVTPVDGATDFPSTVTWEIKRATPQTQLTDYGENDDFGAESHEDALDKLTHITQDRQDELNRALKVPTTDSAIGELPNSVDRASKYLTFDASGDPTAAAAPADTTAVSTFAATILDDTSAEAVRTTIDALEDSLAAEGDLVIADASNDAIALAIGSAGQALGVVSGRPAWQDLLVPRNMILNGAKNVNQRVGPYDGTSTYPNDDDTYCFDHVLHLADGNDTVDITDVTADVPGGFAHALQAEVETANRKFGFLYPIENRDCAAALGGSQVVSVGFWAKTGTTGQIENLRVGVISWTGTVDSITSDVVSAWEAEGTNPTLITSPTWAYENTPANIAITSTWTQYTVLNVAIDTASTNNIALFIWVDDTNPVVNDTLLITGVQMNVGARLAPFEHVPFAEELQRCERFFTKTFDYAVEPAQNTSDRNGCITEIAHDTGARDLKYDWRFPVVMFAAPTVTTYNPNEANNDWRDQPDGATVAASVENQGTGSVHIYGTTGVQNVDYMIHASAEAVM